MLQERGLYRKPDACLYRICDAAAERGTDHPLGGPGVGQPLNRHDREACRWNKQPEAELGSHRASGHRIENAPLSEYQTMHGITERSIYLAFDGKTFGPIDLNHQGGSNTPIQVFRRCLFALFM